MLMYYLSICVLYTHSHPFTVFVWETLKSSFNKNWIFNANKYVNVIDIMFGYFKSVWITMSIWYTIFLCIGNSFLYLTDNFWQVTFYFTYSKLLCFWCNYIRFPNYSSYHISPHSSTQPSQLNCQLIIYR